MKNLLKTYFPKIGKIQKTRVFEALAIAHYHKETKYPIVDILITIVQTAKKLGINAYDYIFDIVSKKFELPSLADIIAQKSLEIKMVKI